MIAQGGYDYIVVGAGPAGCAVAGRLAERGARTLLIEAGGRPWHPLLSIPLAAWMAMMNPRFHWSYRTERVPLLGGRRLPLLAGRVIGGGAAINGMMFLRGGRPDYDRWRDVAGCTGWGFDDVLPYFRRFEASERGEGVWHGGTGPVRTSRAGGRSELAQRFLAAAEAAGLPLVDDLNAEDGEAAGWFDTMTGGGRRSLPGAAYLRRGRRSGNLTVASGARAVRIDFAGTTARGVTYLAGGREHRAEAGAEVILSAGAIESAHLLMLSGIGPAQDLAAAGVQPLLDRPEVGASLQNHLALSLDYACPRGLTLTRYLDARHAVPAALRYGLRRDGALATTPCPVGAVLRADPDGEGADSQVIMGGGLPPDSGHSGFRLMVNHGRPHSRGRIALASADPLAAPVIHAGWDDPADLVLLRRAAERAREIAAQSPLAEIVEHELSPGVDIAGDAALDAVIRDKAASYFHTIGTCRMGSDGGAVVDLALRVNGIAGLRIADNSIAPLQINGNTAACALMIGERAAALIAGESALASP